MDPVVHFEMPYDDAERVARFYSQAFGWQMQELGEEMGHYVVATTTEPGEDGMPKNPGAINGGLYARDTEAPSQYPSFVIAVDDLRAAMEKVARSGGTVLGEPMDIGGIGLYIAFVDTEGNRLSLLQPSPREAGPKEARA